jgi:glycosyltransferase involved in cell wall biosynthesis
MTKDEQGLLVPPCDSAALGQAVIRLLQDRELAQRLGESGRKRALEFSWPVLAGRVEALYHRLLRENPRPRYGGQRC